MLDILLIPSSGLVAGALHVLAGPDHLAAIAPLAVDSRQRRWWVGFTWGLGHTGGVLLVATLALLLRGYVSSALLSSVSERAVGIALIAVGVWGFRRAARLRVHVHTHTHDASRHSHVHVHGRAGRHDPAHEPEAHPSHRHAAVSLGVLHGAAGSSHLFGVLPALALPTVPAALGYLVGFSLGTVLAMAVYSSLMGLLAAGVRGWGAAAYRGLLYGCSAAAILIGGVWLGA